MNKKLLVLLALVMTVTILAPRGLAGAGYRLTCKNPDCRWTGSVSFGGGKAFEQITGYCVESGDFVYLKWRRGGEKPEPLCRVWAPLTGETIELFKSPDCEGCFLPIKGINDLTHCPRCGRPTLEYKRKVMYD